MSRAIPQSILRAAIILVVVGAGCEPEGRSLTSSEMDQLSDLWRTEKHEAYPFVTPIPPLQPTTIDGVYKREVTVRKAGGSPVGCRRCAPYRIEAGVTTMTLSDGRFHVHHDPLKTKMCADCKPAPPFDARGHYTMKDPVISLFNDPNCSQVVGTYRTTRQGDSLRLELIEDPCDPGLRGRLFPFAGWKRQ